MLHLGGKRVYQAGFTSRPDNGGSMQDQLRKSITTLVFVLCSGLGAGAVAQVAPTELKASAPDRYVVVPGDTLWSIAERYLTAPQRWPDLWTMNRETVKNPHRIYPGDVLILDKFLKPRERAWFRRTLNLLSQHLVTRLDVVFEEVLAAVPELKIASDTPVFAGGWFRSIRLTKAE